MSKKYLVVGCWLLVVGLIGFGLAATSSDPSYCCEKTTNGAWCVNAEESACASGYNSAPTSCETTSYCKLGTCYDSEEGICMGNTPQKSCLDSGGTWTEGDPSEVAQCQLGCCIVADQAAFVSLVRCKRLSTMFGVENNYDSSITDEVSCISLANSQDVGACVYEQDFENVCEFTTRGECGASESVEIADTNVTNGTVDVSSGKKFYKDYLCSAEELGTTCARQSSTTCYGGDVYWVDSCGNRENVYSSDLDKSWNNGRVLDADLICSRNSDGSTSCGNCDYMSGTRCAEFTGIVGGPSKGDYYCQKTECKDRDGNSRINGESWCVNDENSGDGKDTVGSRYYREICVDGEVKVEACADYRNEICIEDSIDSFSVAACRVNRWQDCLAQTEEDDCLNQDVRDCKWMDSVLGMIIGVSNSSSGGSSYSNPTTDEEFSNPTKTSNFTGSVIAPLTGNSIFGGDDDTSTERTVTNRKDGVCVPNFPPGLAFWEEGSAQQVCGSASAKCVVKYEKHLYDSDWEVIQGEECLSEEWAKQANDVCVALGDCGGYVNFNGVETDDGYDWKFNGENKTL